MKYDAQPAPGAASGAGGAVAATESVRRNVTGPDPGRPGLAGRRSLPTRRRRVGLRPPAATAHGGRRRCRAREEGLQETGRTPRAAPHALVRRTRRAGGKAHAPIGFRPWPGLVQPRVRPWWIRSE
eukprot:scaffold764_cov408-Prasinococcus_capsulatus_cf.AAC.2